VGVEVDLGRRHRLGAHLRQGQANAVELLSHQRAQLVDLEVALAPIHLGAPEHGALRHHALAAQPVAELQQRIALLVLELPARRAGVPHQPGHRRVEHRGAALRQHRPRARHSGLPRPEEVVAVALEVLKPERLRVSLEALNPASVLRLDRDRDVVVGHHDDQRQPPQAGRRHRLVHVALGGGAVAHDRHRQPRLAPQLQPPRVPTRLAELHPDRALHRHQPDVRCAQVHHHLPPARVRVRHAPERLPKIRLDEVFPAPQRGRHRRQRVAPVVAKVRQGPRLIALLAHHPVKSQRRGRPVDLFARPPNPELHALAARLHRHRRDDRRPRLQRHFVRLPQLAGR
jgi:hypothetical protein